MILPASRSSPVHKTAEQAFTLSGQSSNNLSIRLDNPHKFKLSIGNRVLKSELKEDGIIPVISANVKEYFGKINDEIITDYSKPYILWGIDGDWMVNYLEKGIKFYPTDHCGYIQVLDDNIKNLFRKVYDRYSPRLLKKPFR